MTNRPRPRSIDNGRAHVRLDAFGRRALRRCIEGESLSAGERDVLFLNGLARRFGDDVYPTPLGESVYSCME